MKDLERKSKVSGRFKVVDFHDGDRWRCLCECGAVNLFTRADLESGRARCRCAEAGDPSFEITNAGLRSSNLRESPSAVDSTVNHGPRR